MKPGVLYKIKYDKLSFIDTTTGTVLTLPKDTVLTCLECKWVYDGKQCFYLCEGKIICRQISKLEEYLTEIKIEQ